MSETEKRLADVTEILDFIEKAPANQDIIDMDCNDHCEQLASLAEQVADGATLQDILPELEEHMRYWGDCREEFMALVSVLKAEMLNDMPELPESEEG